MITSTVTQLHWYTLLNPYFSKAIQYALTTDLAALEPGKYAIEDDNVFVIINEYTTKPAGECDPESHQEYADIQVMLNGAEKFGYLPLTDQEPATPFQSDNDVAFYSIPESELNYITLHPGQFIIFFPTDIHQPEVFVEQPSLVKKAVFKVRVSREEPDLPHSLS